jgi:hypothetical protein
LVSQPLRLIKDVRKQLDCFLKVWVVDKKIFGIIRDTWLSGSGQKRGVGPPFSPGSRRGMEMAAIERDAAQSEPFHDFKWHQLHRGRHNIQLVDVMMLLGWGALVGWVLLHQ